MELDKIAHVATLPGGYSNNLGDGISDDLVNTFLNHGWKLIKVTEINGDFVIGCDNEVYSEWPEPKIEEQRKIEYPRRYDLF